jgi:hypothetical protein
MLHDVGDEIEHVYFPNTGMVSLVAVMQSGATVETAAMGRSGVIGANAGLGARSTVTRAIVRLPGTAAWLSADQFRTVANQCLATHCPLQRSISGANPTIGSVQCAPCSGGKALPLAAESSRLC